MVRFLPGLWMLLKWPHSRHSPWRHLCFRKLRGQRDKWTFATGRRRMKEDPAALLTRCMWLTWSNLCLCPQAWIAFQFSFSPKLTVISCWQFLCLFSYRVQPAEGKGELVLNIWATFSALHALHREKRVNTSGQHNEACQRLVVITIPLWECGPAAFLWGGGVGALDSVSKQSLGSYFKNAFKKSVHILLAFVPHAKTVVSKSATAPDQTVPRLVICNLTVFSLLLNR